MRMRGGFTLVEVALAVLIVALGLMAVMGLLPSALRMSEDAVTFTREACFAETLFAGLRANVVDAPPFAWSNESDFVQYACGEDIPGIGSIYTNTSANDDRCKIIFPKDDDPAATDVTNLWYRLAIVKNSDVDKVPRYTASLIICDNVYSKQFVTNAVFWTGLTYAGITNAMF